MFKKILSSTILFPQGVVIVRIISGLLVSFHGLGIFNPGHMEGNIAWLSDIHFPSAPLMAYVGKGSELLGGLLLCLGLFTRFACIALIFTMSVITFIMGHGKIWNEDQMPFLLLLLFLLFLCIGGGMYSLDSLFFKTRKES